MQGWEGLRPLVDENSPTPLYHQVFLVLRDRIRHGQIEDNAMLPNEMRLAALFSVSRITIKRALAELVAEGMVVRQRGVGTMVKAPQLPMPLVQGAFDNWIENLEAFDRDVEVELLDVSETTADAVLAKHLGIATGAMVQSVTRLRKVAGAPFAHVVAWVPARVAARYEPSGLATTPMLALLERAGFKPADAEQWISAVTTPQPIAALLGMPVPEAALLLEQIMHDADGNPLQFLRAHYHAERFRYHVQISRKSR